MENDDSLWLQNTQDLAHSVAWRRNRMRRLAAIGVFVVITCTLMVMLALVGFHVL